MSSRAKRKAAKANKRKQTEVKKAESQVEISPRTCTGQNAGQPGARDLKYVNFSLSFHGQDLIHDTMLELNYGNRYGLIGRNGSGKTTFLRALANRDIDIPSHFDMYLLQEEAEPTDMTALETVVGAARDEVARLEKKEEELMESDEDHSEVLNDIYERLDELDPTTFDKRAGELLWGLGFRAEMSAKSTKDMSGGWRMRVALAKALFIKPTLLLLDEPTNHLDLETCVWLEEYLSRYPKILLLISHSQDFLDGVCTHIMHLTPQRTLRYYGGNYSQFVKTKQENETQQMKQYHKQQEEIKHIKEFIASCGTFSNLVKQAKSRQKLLDKMVDDGLIEEVVPERHVNLDFPDCGKLPPPVLGLQEVSFAYSGKMKDALYTNIDLGIDLDSRIVLVGPNGAGKSTLLKLLTGELEPTQGIIQRHAHLRMAKFNQHSADVLDDSMTPIDFMRSEFASFNWEVSVWRQQLGKYGITGKHQTMSIGTMSDGQKSNLVFCWLAQKTPHMLLFDEPTNHLDMESIDGLAAAINRFEGGMILVSHDFRLLQECAKEVWVCDNKTIEPWKGDILSYKNHLKKTMKKYVHQE